MGDPKWLKNLTGIFRKVPYKKIYVLRTFEMFQLTLPMELEEFVALKAGSLQFEQSSKSLAQFQVVDQVISTKDNQTKLQVK